MSFENNGTPVKNMNALTKNDSLLGVDEGNAPATFPMEAVSQSVKSWIDKKEVALPGVSLQKGDRISGYRDGAPAVFTYTGEATGPVEPDPEPDPKAGHVKGGDYRLVAQKSGNANVIFSSIKEDTLSLIEPRNGSYWDDAIKGGTATVTYKGVQYPTPFTEAVTLGDSYTLHIPHNEYLEAFWCEDGLTNADLTGMNPVKIFRVQGNDLVMLGDLTGMNPINVFYMNGSQLAFTGDLSTCRPKTEFMSYSNAAVITGLLTGLSPSKRIYIEGLTIDFTGDVSTFRGETLFIKAQANLTGDGDVNNPDNTGYQGEVDIVDSPGMVNWEFAPLVMPTDGSLIARRFGYADIEFYSTKGTARMLWNGQHYKSPFRRDVVRGETYKIIVPAGDTLEHFVCKDGVTAGDLTNMRPTKKFRVQGNALKFTGDLTNHNPSQYMYVNGSQLAFTGDLSNCRPQAEFLFYSNKSTVSGDLTGLNPIRRIYIDGELLAFTGSLTGYDGALLNCMNMPNVTGDGTGYEGEAKIVNSPGMENWNLPPAAESSPSVTDLADATKWVPFTPMTDEFNGTTLDDTKWHGINPTWSGKQPGQFVKENVKVSGGDLRITGKKDLDKKVWNKGYHTYTTGAVKSKGLVKYGYFEIDCKPHDSHIVSAYWLYNHDVAEWTEIDMFEIAGGVPGKEGDTPMTVHMFYNEDGYDQTPTYVPDHYQVRRTWKAPFKWGKDPKHKFGLLWEPDFITWFVDGNKVWKIKNTFWHQELYLNMDLHVFLNRGKPLDKDLPADFELNYCRVWQKAGGY